MKPLKPKWLEKVVKEVYTNAKEAEVKVELTEDIVNLEILLNTGYYVVL